MRIAPKLTAISIICYHKEFIKKHVKYVTSLQNTLKEKVSMPILKGFFH